MTVRIGKEQSEPRPVNAGAPQGSVLFNIGVDDLEEDYGCEEELQQEAHQETLGRTDDFPAASTPIRVRETNEPGLREKADLDTLYKRREDISLRFAKKSLGNPRSSHWFQERRIPVYARPAGVVYPKFKEDTARADRHRNTPKNYLIRKLNQNQ